VMVSLNAGGTRLLSRITRKSAIAMGLQPGRAIYAQIKGVAILR
jgi:molybdate transport system ATP-binding protein